VDQWEGAKSKEHFKLFRRLKPATISDLINGLSREDVTHDGSEKRYSNLL